MRRHAKIGALAGILAAALAVAACSGSASAPQNDGLYQAGMQASAAAPAAPPAAPEGAQSGGGAALGGDTGSTGKNVVAPDQPLIVKTGSMVLDVEDLDATILRARSAITGLGGYVSGSDRADSGDQKVASVTYRIPAARWDDALDALHKLATKVEKEQTNTVEVTGQVLDLGARITNLQVTERALQAIMEKATKISDILEVQNQLTTVQGQIEELSTQKAHLEDQAATSTLSVVFQVPVVATTTAAKSWDLGEQVDAATASLIELGQGLASALIWLGIVGLPLVLVLLIVLVPLAWLLRRMAGRRQTSSTPGMWGGGTATPSA